VKRITGDVKADLVANQNDDLRGCYLPFVAADGTVLAHCIVLKGTVSEDGTLMGDFVVKAAHNHFLRCTPQNAPTYFFFSTTGAVNTEMFKAMRLLATERFKMLYPGLQSLWLGDNACFQAEPSMLLEFMHKHNAVSLFTPASKTHIFGVLDGPPFAVLTQVMAKNVHEATFYKTIQGQTLHGTTLSALLDALKAFADPKVIQKGFDKRFPFPISGARVMEVFRAHPDACKPSLVRQFPMLDKVAEVAREMLDKKVQEDTTVRRAIGLARNRAYTSLDLQEKADKADAAKAAMQAENEAARLAEKERLQAARRQREIDIDERHQRQLEQRAASLCRICTGRNCGLLANWRGCEVCDFWVCGPCIKSSPTTLPVHESRAHQKSPENNKRIQ
jgi:hypothetical protein